MRNYCNMFSFIQNSMTEPCLKNKHFSLAWGRSCIQPLCSWKSSTVSMESDIFSWKRRLYLFILWNWNYLLVLLPGVLEAILIFLLCFPCPHGVTEGGRAILCFPVRHLLFRLALCVDLSLRLVKVVRIKMELLCQAWPPPTMLEVVKKESHAPNLGNKN